MPSTPQRPSPTPFLGHAASLLLCLWALIVAAPAQSVLNFPRLPPGSDQLTGIALFNPNNRPVSVEFTAYGADGTPLAGPGFRNPVLLTIFANRQASAITSELFGRSLPASTVAWFQGTSVTDGIDGFFLALDDTTSFLDGAQLPESATRILFSQVRISPGSRTELNLINPNPSPAQVSLRLHGGGANVERSLSLAAMGAARLDPTEFFEVELLPVPAVVTATSDQPVAGFQLVHGEGDAFGLNARPVEQTVTRLDFPQFAALPPFQTQLQISNTGAEAAMLTISAYRADGRLFAGDGVGENPTTRNLEAGGTLSEGVAELFGFTGDGPTQGWLQVRSSTPGVEGALVYSVPATGSLAAVADARPPRRRSIFAYIATSQDFFTGVAIVNTSTVVANLRLVALRPDGGTLGEASLVLGPKQRVSKLITELIPESVGQAGGVIWIDSDVPVRATSLFGSESAGVLANVPPQSISQDYLPANASERTRTTPELSAVVPGGSLQFAWSGAGATPIWRVNGIAGGNAELGTINGLGQYQAPMVPPGSAVTVTAERGRQTSGATVDPLNAPTRVVDLGVLQSIAFSDAERRLYAAELVTPVGGSTQESGTQLLDVTNGTRRLVSFFSTEEIPDMLVLPWTDRDRLLLAFSEAGTVLRLDPDTLEQRTVATGLIQTRALALDPLTGDLLVADATGLIRIPAVRVTQGLPGAPPAVGPNRSTLVAGGNPSGVAIDRCSGNIYYSDSVQGRLIEYLRPGRTTRVALEGLNQPGALIALHRQGLPCPDSLHLLVVEQGADRLRLVVPSRETSSPWFDLQGLSGALATVAPGAHDLESILLTGFPRGLNGSVFQLTLPPVYRLDPDPSP